MISELAPLNEPTLAAAFRNRVGRATPTAFRESGADGPGRPDGLPPEPAGIHATRPEWMHELRVVVARAGRRALMISMATGGRARASRICRALAAAATSQGSSRLRIGRCSRCSAEQPASHRLGDSKSKRG